MKGSKYNNTQQYLNNGNDFLLLSDHQRSKVDSFSGRMEGEESSEISSYGPSRQAKFIKLNQKK